MGDERKTQNLPARPTSSLMGQLVRQRQGAEVAPAQQQSTGVAGAQQATGVGGAKSAGPPPGASGVARPGGAQTGVAGGRPASNVPAAEGPSRADIERIDAKDEFGHYDGGHGGGGGGGRWSRSRIYRTERPWREILS